MSDWQVIDTDEEELLSTVIDTFTQLYQDYFIREELVNHNLPIEIRAFRQMDIWSIFLLLTPWTLARLFIPHQDPNIEIPTGWSTAERLNAPIIVIGPAISLSILGGKERAHLNYTPSLGHYLIQPLIQSMAQFNTPDEAFAAWNAVITTRNKVIEEQKRKCEWQQDVSRREFFAKLRRRASLK